MANAKVLKMSCGCYSWEVLTVKLSRNRTLAMLRDGLAVWQRVGQEPRPLPEERDVLCEPERADVAAGLPGPASTRTSKQETARRSSLLGPGHVRG